MDTADLIRRARWASGLTQTQLARATGVAPAALCRYERGSRVPSVATLVRLLEATGHQVSAELEPLDADLVEPLERAQQVPVNEREGALLWGWAGTWLTELPHRVEGLAALSIMGAPVRCRTLDIALAPRTADWARLARAVREYHATLVQQGMWVGWRPTDPVGPRPGRPAARARARARGSRTGRRGGCCESCVNGPWSPDARVRQQPRRESRVPEQRRITKVLIANRGEIAVRVARACRDAGIASVAVYADPDRDALHVRTADEAYALGGETSAETYLVVDKLLDVAARSGADAVHPGYGFLAENAGFAQAVIDAGLAWIGPPPAAIEALGDKVSARHIAQRAGAPLVAGTPDPVAGVDEVVAFAEEHGLPVAIKAAFGGGGRGLKVARSLEEIPDLYDSAVREAVSAFGRGECFVERYLDRPRHVETQCLADQHGTVVVVSTRDCSLQRRHQKLVEEAPAPFLSDEQVAELYRASKAILREAGYVGAGTCEFLVGQDGTISFLEVNTRLQVEHPVSEEVTGIDLVREMFRVAEGQELGYDDPEVRGHSIEFRVNGEDPGRSFLPTPGPVAVFRPPSGPGVRLDTGVEQGSVIGQNFDSLLAKLIVTGATRQQALERSRRALAEFEVEGLATALPFHRAVVGDAAFAPDDPAQHFTVHTLWIETEWTGGVAPYAAPGAADDEPSERERVTVEVGGKRLEVVLPAGLGAGVGTAGTARAARKPARRTGGRAGAGAAGGDSLASPMQGTIVKVAVEDGQQVEAGDLVVVLEAMKMEQPIAAHRSGTVSGLEAEVGATVSSGAVLCQITD